jgi:hypothetical protein
VYLSLGDLRQFGEFATDKPRLKYGAYLPSRKSRLPRAVRQGGPSGHSLRSIRRSSFSRSLISGDIRRWFRSPSMSAVSAPRSAAVRTTGFAIDKT